MPDSPTLRASIALAAYAEPLIEGRRVIVFGDASSGLAEHLLERGARLVHVYDADPMRLAEAATRNTSRNVAFAPLAETGLAVREGAFDVAIAENLAASADAAGLVKRARKALSPRGALLAAAPNPEIRVQLLAEPLPAATELDYYALYDLVAAEFEQVRMLGQLPFVGYSVVDFAPDGEPEPALDAGFVPGGAEEPEWFVALAAQRAVRLDDFAVVQLPFRVALDQRARPRERAPAAVPAAAAVPAPAPVPAPAFDPAPLRAEIATLKSELAQRDAWIAQLESRAEAADTRADEVQAESDEWRSGAETARKELEGARRRIKALEAELVADQARLGNVAALEAQAARAKTLEAEAARAKTLEATAARAEALEAEAARAAALERELARVSSVLEKIQQTDTVDTSEELAALEAQLLERGAEIRRLEQELRATERLARQLLDELDLARSGDNGAAAEVGALGQKLDALAALNAEREADLQAARWTIAALEARLTDKHAGASVGNRERLEEDLQQARADLQRLAALVEQLKSAADAGAEAPR